MMANVHIHRRRRYLLVVLHSYGPSNVLHSNVFHSKVLHLNGLSDVLHSYLLHILCCIVLRSAVLHA